MGGCLGDVMMCVVGLDLWVLPLVVVPHRTHSICLYSTCKPPPHALVSKLMCLLVLYVLICVCRL